MTTRGSAGHVGPLAPFGHALRDAGHEVIVAAQHQNRAHVERTGLAYSPVADPPDDEWMPLLGGYAQLDMEASNALMIGEFFARIDARAALPGLRTLVEDWQPDAIVRDSWEFASTIVAELYEIPLARVGLGLAAVEELSIGLAAPAVDAIRADVGLPPGQAADRMGGTPYFTTVPEALEIDPTRSPGRTTRLRHGVLDAEGGLPDWWPGNHDPLVYLSFGTIAAAAHLPYFPLLYRAAIAALAPLGVRLLVTIGNHQDPGLLGPQPPNVHVERWVAQDAVAAHATVFVGHGGYGSTLGALAYGVPLVVVPLFSIDQWANAEAVARAGAGIALDAGRHSRRVFELPSAHTLDQLRAAVSDVLADAAYGRAARQIADAMRILPPVGAAVGELTASGSAKRSSQ